MKKIRQLALGTMMALFTALACGGIDELNIPTETEGRGLACATWDVVQYATLTVGPNGEVIIRDGSWGNTFAVGDGYGINVKASSPPSSVRCYARPFVGAYEEELPLTAYVTPHQLIWLFKPATTSQYVQPSFKLKGTVGQVFEVATVSCNTQP